jgi:tetratricopeptide (TPR) repeat protein
MEKVLIADGGNEYTESTVKRREVKNLNSDDKSLILTLFREGGTKAAEELDAKGLNEAERRIRKDIDKNNPEKREDALKEYNKGKDSLTKKDYKEALQSFLNADATYPSFKPKYYIALCLDKLDRRKDALKMYKQCVNTDMNIKENFRGRVAKAKKRIKELESEKTKLA